jgi:hypothetical protein
MVVFSVIELCLFKKKGIVRKQKKISAAFFGNKKIECPKF